MRSPGFYQELIEDHLKQLPLPERPVELYDPIRYMLSLGGKRIRPVLLLMSAELFGAETVKALPAAIGLEVFHNFTLLHDDIMDKAPLRRSQATVHTRWNQDIAILSGDTMFVKAVEYYLQTATSNTIELTNRFLKTATEVCEGQQLDMNFEKLQEVSIADYINMIRLKTAVLIGHSLEAGAMIAGASAEDAALMYEFGTDLGIAFQLHDDMLDLYGEADKVGKQTGGDILANKKTYLLIKAFELASDKHRDDLSKHLLDPGLEPEIKVSSVRNIFDVYGIRQLTGQASTEYFTQAMSVFDKIKIDPERKKPLLDLVQKLMVRQS